MTKKKILAIGLAILMVFALSMCGETESQSNAQVDLKGTFLLTSNDDNLNAELETGKKYVLAVFDIINSGNDNVHVSNLSANLQFADNKYPVIIKPGKILNSFFKNDGYYDYSFNQEILGSDTNPKRVCIAFQINPNDLTGDRSANLSISANGINKTTFPLTFDDFQEISVPDGIFAVEENPDEYQIIHSIKSRVTVARGTFGIVKSTLQEVSLSGHSKYDAEQLATLINASKACLGTYPVDIGVSVITETMIASTDLPFFDISTVSKTYPELVEKIKLLGDYLGKFSEAGLTTDDACDLCDKAIDLANEIIDYFE